MAPARISSAPPYTPPDGDALGCARRGRQADERRLTAGARAFPPRRGGERDDEGERQREAHGAAVQDDRPSASRRATCAPGATSACARCRDREACGEAEADRGVGHAVHHDGGDDLARAPPRAQSRRRGDGRALHGAHVAAAAPRSAARSTSGARAEGKAQLYHSIFTPLATRSRLRADVEEALHEARARP